MHKRINVTLPETTVRLIDRVAPKGDRSRFTSEAVRHYVEDMGRQKLKDRAKAGAIARATRDLSLASEWLALDQQALQTTKNSPKAQRGLRG